MAGMLDLRDVFELIGDGAFAQKELVGPVQQPVVHLFTQLGDELKPLSDQQLLGQGLREVAFVPKELSHQTFRELRNRMPIIDIDRSQAECQDLALIIDDQVELEAIEPADRGLTTSSTAVKDAMGVDASVVTDGKGGGVDKA